MNKQTILTIVAAVMPSYFASFSDSTAACVIVFLSTLLLTIITAGVGADLMDKVRLAWILHLLGMCVTFGVHSF